MNRLVFTIILSVFVLCKAWCTDTRENIISLNSVSATVSLSTSNTYEWEWDSTSGRLRSTNYNKDKTTSQTTLSISIPTTCDFSFYYAVSSEQNYDKLTITLDGEIIVNEISGNISEEYTSVLSAGTHSIILKYVKDISQSNNDDRAYISNLKFEETDSEETESEETIEYEGITYRINQNGLTIINGNAVEGDLIIPSKIPLQKVSI